MSEGNGQAVLEQNGSEGGATRLRTNSLTGDGGYRAGESFPAPKGRGVIDKVERFGWEMVDAPGEFLLIPKGDLLVDHAYQRDQVSSPRVDAIASEWSWVACGAILVARRVARNKATFWVMDGQHRKLAADKRSDIKELPCLVFDAVGQRHEAASFVRANTMRGAVSAAVKFRAEVVAGNAEALAIKAMLDAHGYRVVPSNDAPKTLRCIYAVQGSFRADPEACKRLFALCAELEPLRALPKQLFAGLWKLDRHLTAGGHGSLCDAPWRGPLLAAGGERLVRHMDARAVEVGKNSAKAWADGVLMRVLNKGRRGKRPPSLYLADASDD